MTKFREKTVSAGPLPVFFLEILSPLSPILGHNWKHDLARSCFILKLVFPNLVQKLHLEVALQFFSALVPAQKGFLQVHCHYHCSCLIMAGFVSKQMKIDQKVKLFQTHKPAWSSCCASAICLLSTLQASLTKRQFRPWPTYCISDVIRCGLENFNKSIRSPDSNLPGEHKAASAFLALLAFN